MVLFNHSTHCYSHRLLSNAVSITRDVNEVRTLEAEARTLEAETRTLEAEETQFWP